jgi:hypothetical protein
MSSRIRRAISLAMTASISQFSVSPAFATATHPVSSGKRIVAAQAAQPAQAIAAVPSALTTAAKSDEYVCDKSLSRNTCAEHRTWYALRNQRLAEFLGDGRKPLAAADLIRFSAAVEQYARFAEKVGGANRDYSADEFIAWWRSNANLYSAHPVPTLDKPSLIMGEFYSEELVPDYIDYRSKQEADRGVLQRIGAYSSSVTNGAEWFGTAGFAYIVGKIIFDGALKPHLDRGVEKTGRVSASLPERFRSLFAPPKAPEIALTPAQAEARMAEVAKALGVTLKPEELHPVRAALVAIFRQSIDRSYRGLPDALKPALDLVTEAQIVAAWQAASSAEVNRNGQIALARTNVAAHSLAEFDRLVALYEKLISTDAVLTDGDPRLPKIRKLEAETLQSLRSFAGQAGLAALDSYVENAKAAVNARLRTTGLIALQFVIKGDTEFNINSLTPNARAAYIMMRDSVALGRAATEAIVRRTAVLLVHSCQDLAGLPGSAEQAVAAAAGEDASDAASVSGERQGLLRLLRKVNPRGRFGSAGPSLGTAGDSEAAKVKEEILKPVEAAAGRR